MEPTDSWTKIGAEPTGGNDRRLEVGILYKNKRINFLGTD